MTDDVIEMPRSCSRRIQSDVACRVALRPLTAPAIWIAPPNSSSFSVSVVLPASGCEMIANVRLFRCSCMGKRLREVSGTGCSVAARITASSRPFSA